VGKEEKADKGKGEVPNKKTKKTKIKLNKRSRTGNNEEKDRVRTDDYKKGLFLASSRVSCLVVTRMLGFK
jgi:hypothetical protein